MLLCPSLLYFKIMDLFFLSDGIYVSFFRIVKCGHFHVMEWYLYLKLQCSIVKHYKCL